MEAEIKEKVWRALKFATPEDWLNEFLTQTDSEIRGQFGDGYIKISQKHGTSIESVDRNYMRSKYHELLSKHYELINDPDFVVDPRTFEALLRIHIRKKNEIIPRHT